MAATCKLHPGAPAEPVLCAWSIDVDRKPVFMGLTPAVSESATPRRATRPSPPPTAGREKQP